MGFLLGRTGTELLPRMGVQRDEAGLYGRIGGEDRMGGRSFGCLILSGERDGGCSGVNAVIDGW